MCVCVWSGAVPPSQSGSGYVLGGAVLAASCGGAEGSVPCRSTKLPPHPPARHQYPRVRDTANTHHPLARSLAYSFIHSLAHSLHLHRVLGCVSTPPKTRTLTRTQALPTLTRTHALPTFTQSLTQFHFVPGHVYTPTLTSSLHTHSLTTHTHPLSFTLSKGVSACQHLYTHWLSFTGSLLSQSVIHSPSCHLLQFHSVHGCV